MVVQKLHSPPLHQGIPTPADREGCQTEILANTRPTDIPKESWYLLDISFRPGYSILVLGDLHWVLAMKTAKRYMLMQERAKAQQCAGARRHVKKMYRNLLDRVGESLQRWLQVNKPAVNRRLAQSTNIDKQPCIEQVVPSVAPPQQRTLASYWQRQCPTLFIFGQ